MQCTLASPHGLVQAAALEEIDLLETRVEEEARRRAAAEQRVEALLRQQRLLEAQARCTNGSEARPKQC